MDMHADVPSRTDETEASDTPRDGERRGDAAWRSAPRRAPGTMIYGDPRAAMGHAIDGFREVAGRSPMRWAVVATKLFLWLFLAALLILAFMNG